MCVAACVLLFGLCFYLLRLLASGCFVWLVVLLGLGYLLILVFVCLLFLVFLIVFDNLFVVCLLRCCFMFYCAVGDLLVGLLWLCACLFASVVLIFGGGLIDCVGLLIVLLCFTTCWLFWCL